MESTALESGTSRSAPNPTMLCGALNAMHDNAAEARKAHLQALMAQSETAYNKLLVANRKDAAEYGEPGFPPVPAEDSLWVWELETCAVTESWGRTDRNTYRNLFVSLKSAQRSACEEIKRYLVSSTYDEYYAGLINAGEYDRALELFQRAYGNRRFTFRLVEVKA